MSDKVERVIIIVWKWGDNPGSEISGEHFEQWRAQDEGQLVLLDIRAEDDRPFIAELASRFTTRKTLVFLHDSSPNNLNETARAQLSKQLKKKRDNFRLICFSGGSEPLYFAGHKFGILGINGKFPVKKRPSPDGKIKYLPFIDQEKKIIAQQNFDFIWDFYWHGRRQRILELAEEFGIWAMGAKATLEAEPESNLADYFRQQPGLWGKLLEYMTAEDGDVPNQAGEFNMATYLDYLNIKGKQLESLEQISKYGRQSKKSQRYFNAAEELKKNQEYLKKALYAPLENNSDATRILSNVYNEMIQLFAALPEDSL